MWHVAHVITRLELGGAQLATLDEVANLPFATAGRSLLFGPGGVLDEDARRLLDVAVYEIPAMRREVSGSDLRAFVQIWRCLRHIKQQHRQARLLVHTHCPKAGILGRWAAFFAGADLIVHSAHGWGYQEPTIDAKLFTALKRMTAIITDGVTADSAKTLEAWTAQGLAGKADTSVVYCGIDVTEFGRVPRPAAEVRENLGIPDGDHVVLNISCLKPQKDPLSYVRLAHTVLRQFPDATFLIAGDGSLRQSVEHLAADLNLGSRFRLLGWRRDVRDLIHASDVFVMTSLWEGLPQAIVQAMSAGVPVVATAVDGVPEAIENEVDGLLYRPGEVDAMAAAVVDLLRDEPRRRRLGEHARRKAALFSRETMLRTLNEFYEEMARRSIHPASAPARSRIPYPGENGGGTGGVVSRSFE